MYYLKGIVYRKNEGEKCMYVVIVKRGLQIVIEQKKLINVMISCEILHCDLW